MKSIANPRGWQDVGLSGLLPTPSTVLICGNAANTLLHAAMGTGRRPILPHLGLVGNVDGVIGFGVVVFIVLGASLVV